MILRFPGGIKPETRSTCAAKAIEAVGGCTAVCMLIPSGCELSVAVPEGGAVRRGDFVATVDGTPRYSPIPGEFRGRMEIDGEEYLVVTADGSVGEVAALEPETRRLNDLSFEDVLGAVRALSIIDTRSGRPLWRMMSELNGSCRRVIVDGTEPDACSAIAGRLCTEKSRSVIGGAKILLHAMSANKAVVAAECDKNEAFELMSRHVAEGFPLTFARLEVKYPYDDRALMYAIYVQELERGQTAADVGCLIVSAETAAAVYDCISSGKAMLDRYVGVYGVEVSREANLRIPRGMTVHELLSRCGGSAQRAAVIENSLLNGKVGIGAVQSGTRAIIAVLPKRKIQTRCIRCGRCASVCPVRLIPSHATEKVTAEIASNCTGCGACEYICPAGIPLVSMIKRRKNNDGREEKQ